MAKQAKEKFKTYKGVFDNFTLLTLFKLSSQGHFDELKSPISIGKESNVFVAETKSGDFVAVKIYRLETCDFNRMYDYIRFDPRFSGLLKKRRKVIFAWAQREYRNLLLAHDLRVAAPSPIAVRNNVLIEEFIGNANPAPRLVNLPPKNKKEFFDNIIKNITKLYKRNLTHGDLSQFNILNHNQKPVLIDFSQATVSNNTLFEELFERDVSIICKYFIKLGLKLDTQKVINKIKAGK